MKINVIYNGDVLDKLKEIPDKCVNTCITSPPYFGLRDYGTGEWIGGDSNCKHRRESKKSDNTITGHKNFDDMLGVGDAIYKTICPICGAIRIDKQIGLEETPDAYVAKLVEVFREVRRVLRDDGTLWLNLGDSYAGSGKGSNPDGSPHPSTLASKSGTNRGCVNGKNLPQKANKIGLKPKDLIGIPWRVAFALQADGWYLRQDIIWCLSGGTWVYVRTQKGDMPMTIKDMARLNPSTVKLWNGYKWTQLLGVSKSSRIGNEITLVLRSGERISCTPTHKFPTDKGLLEADKIKIGDNLKSCCLPEPDKPKDAKHIGNSAGWLAGLYIAEGSKSGDTIQISGHVKEEHRWRMCKQIAEEYGGYATRTIDVNKMNIRLYGKVLNALLDELVSGRTAKDKCFSPVVWRYSNEFISSMLDGYLSGDGHLDGERWRLGFCRNYNLERDLRTACARLGYTLTLNMTSVKYKGKHLPTFRGEIRKKQNGHWNEKSRNEVVDIKKARSRYMYDLGVEDEPHVFSLSSGILSHNSKPNPMPESVKDRCTKSHEYIFLLSKSKNYYYNYEAIKEKANPDSIIRDRDNTRLNNTPGRTKMGGLKVNNYETRNKRDVWTVTTKPFKEAHFATFPEKLITPCVLAGCPENGIVIDPFMGSGTTAYVSKKNHRNYIGIELNKEYIDIANKRLKALDNLFFMI